MGFCDLFLQQKNAASRSLHSMSHEERAKWASVICTREVGPQGGLTGSNGIQRIRGVLFSTAHWRIKHGLLMVVSDG